MTHGGGHGHCRYRNCDACDIGAPPPVESAFRWSPMEVLLFPYALCARLIHMIRCFCSSTNSCLMFLFVMHYLICRFARQVPLDPVLSPYYVFMLMEFGAITGAIALSYQSFVKPVFFPYFLSYYSALVGREKENKTTKRVLVFRRYCFRKGEIFDTSMDYSGNLALKLAPWPYSAYYAINFAVLTVDYFLQNFLVQVDRVKLVSIN